MKLFRLFGCIVFLLLLGVAAASVALFIYAPASYAGNDFSIVKSIELAISILDVDTEADFLVVYSAAMPSIIAIVYIFVAIYMVKKFLSVFRILHEIYNFKESNERFTYAFDRATEATMRTVCGMILFLFLADTTIGVRLGEYTVPFIFLSFAVLLLAVLIKSHLLTSSIRYTLLNTLREGLAVPAASITLKYALTITVFDMIIRFNQYAAFDEFANSRVGTYYSYLLIFEPILFVILSFYAFSLFKRVVTLSDNTLGQRNDLIVACRRILFFSVVLAVIRVILTVYCSGANVDTNLNKEFLTYVYNLIKIDLLPMILAVSSIIVLHNGMLCIEFKGTGRAGKILKSPANGRE